MKPRPVKKDKSKMYPTYRTFMAKHRFELGAITAGVGLMVGTSVSAGPKEGVRLMGKPAPPRPPVTKEEKAPKLQGAPRMPVKPAHSQRVPAVRLDKALELAKAAHKKSAIGGKKIFIDEATLVKKNDQTYWKIGYRLADYESGHMYVKVTMDGKVETLSVVKDG